MSQVSDPITIGYFVALAVVIIGFFVALIRHRSRKVVRQPPPMLTMNILSSPDLETKIDMIYRVLVLGWEIKEPEKQKT